MLSMVSATDFFFEQQRQCFHCVCNERRLARYGPPLTPLTQQNNAFNQLEKVFYENKVIMQFLSYGSLVSKTFE